MNGPFFTERMLLALPLHNELIGSFVVSCFVAQGRHTPWSHGMIPLHAAFASTVWMINGIHNNTAYRWTDSQVPSTSGFPHRNVFVIEIPDLSDRRHTINIHQPHFTRRQLHMRIAAFLGDKLRRGSGAASHLSALARTQFDIVNCRTERNISQRQSIADKNVGFRPGNHLHADLQSNWLENVSAFPVGIAEQRDECRTIRIVFDGFDVSWNSDFVATKVDDPIMLLISPAAVADR